MRKLIAFNIVSLDGYFEGPNNDISFFKLDEEFNSFSIEQLKSVGTLLFGRKTYEHMASHWPTEEAIKNQTITANIMNSYPKIVFSETLNKTEWNNTKLIKENAVEEIQKLKKQPGKDLIIFGSADLSTTLMQHHLIDEFRLMVNPVTLGKGKPFFHNKMDLQLLKTKVFGNGNVLLCYRAEK